MLKVDNQGKIKLAGRNWKVGAAFIRKRVQVVTVESRWQIYYCSTLIREFEQESQRTTAVARWFSCNSV